jgi:hypothetical protein
MEMATKEAMDNVSKKPEMIKPVTPRNKQLL